MPARRAEVLDEAATAHSIAEERLNLPVLRHASSRWLDLALIVDGSPSMAVWSALISELRRSVERIGAFRDVRCWRLDQHDGVTGVVAHTEGLAPGRVRSPGELIDPAGRRLFMIVSDCSGPAWHDGSVAGVIGRWAAHGPVGVVQVLPERLWHRTGLPPVGGQLRAPRPGASNRDLMFTPHRRRRRGGPTGAMSRRARPCRNFSTVSAHWRTNCWFPPLLQVLWWRRRIGLRPG